ncbi:uncharacterized protein LOC119370369 [Jatropha curcas]|uniref:uncharacterized protein LOC119370369 n=1 Tax=Jatropha curcas TaxID=180498 RepID=UPI0005FAC4C0|nr:uncharacterized protein LOC119370369 [Jatropha curcas]
MLLIIVSSALAYMTGGFLKCQAISIRMHKSPCISARLVQLTPVIISGWWSEFLIGLMLILIAVKFVSSYSCAYHSMKMGSLVLLAPYPPPGICPTFHLIHCLGILDETLCTNLFGSCKGKSRIRCWIKNLAAEINLFIIIIILVFMKQQMREHGMYDFFCLF